jgi:hypothetical protein
VGSKSIIEALSWNYAKGASKSYDLDASGNLYVIKNGDHGGYLMAHLGVKLAFPQLSVAQVRAKLTKIADICYAKGIRLSDVPYILKVKVTSEALRKFASENKLFATLEYPDKVLVRFERDNDSLTRAQRAALERYCIEHEKSLIIGGNASRKVLYSPPSSGHE